ncbi:hypothetical protein A0H81_00491 [Grifola frondosa]|uniref:Aprataxin and PNK-like factor PBZ domain-containing protein n=1 Tax=Grifola frondosa TaxID=5627 RepID=A0A1C7MQB1_GRIFR|nr:hypothetical protein A0H81_00491 [Grifola frondosa]
MKFSDLSADVIDDLLTFIPDFSTLSAALLTSKQQVYTVFQSRPKSILARVLEENSQAVRTIENFFSFRYKDQASPISRLEPIESSRFRRALYRLWLVLRENSVIPPISLANSLEMAGLDSVPAMYTEDFFKDEFEKIIRARKVDEKTWSERHDKAILNRATERQDQCHRCHAVCGVNLWGASNWSILKGYFSRGEMVNLFPGNLTRNAVEMNAFNVYFEQNPQIDDRMLIEQLMALDVDESGVWAKDKWYCLECVKELFRLRYWKWWLEKKRQDGVTIEEDCWYGYNCRTQRHAQPHAQRLNHLCMPTRGTGPN